MYVSLDEHRDGVHPDSKVIFGTGIVTIGTDVRSMIPLDLRTWKELWARTLDGTTGAISAYAGATDVDTFTLFTATQSIAAISWQDITRTTTLIGNCIAGFVRLTHPNATMIQIMAKR